MSSDERNRAGTAGVGYWEGEELELGRRYAYHPEAVPLLLHHLGAEPQMRILDVGCGTGFLARLLASRLEGAHVTGLDADPKMLTLGREKLRAEGLAERVELRQGNAYDLPFPDASFDLVTSYTVLCILPDPVRALREQLRVVRPGGVISGVVCFCHSAGLPHYHGRYPLPGNHRIDELDHLLQRTFTRTIRPRLLAVDHAILNQDLLWEFSQAGIENLQINGHLMLVSPGDERIPATAGAAYAIALHRKSLERIEHLRAEHGEELAAAGFGAAAFEELLELKRARIAYLEAEPARVKEVMEVFTDPLIIVRGNRPQEPRGP